MTAKRLARWAMLLIVASNAGACSNGLPTRAADAAPPLPPAPGGELDTTGAPHAPQDVATTDSTPPAQRNLAEPVAIEEELIDSPTFASLRLLCATFIASSKTAFENGQWAHLRPRAPACGERQLPVPFRPSGIYRGVRAVRFNNGLSAFTELVAQTGEAFRRTGIAWDLDALHSATPEFASDLVERLDVRGPYLVAVLGGALWEPVLVSGPEGPEGVYRSRYVRGVRWCALEGSSSRCRERSHRPPHLAFKEQIAQLGKGRPWLELPWRDELTFSVLETGELRVTTP